MKKCLFCSTSFISDGWNCPQCSAVPLVNEGFFSFINKDLLSEEVYCAEYYEKLSRIEAEHFWFRYRTRIILNAVRYHFSGAREVLEIGCGTGNVLSSLSTNMSGLSLSGSDLFLEGLRITKNRIPNARLYHMDARNIPFSQEFDLILALDVIEHIVDDTRALREISRSLKPGGGLIVTVPQHQWLWSIQDEKSYHKRRYTRDCLLTKMQSANLRIVHMTSFITILLPLMFLSRITTSLFNGRRKVYNPFREFRITPVLNRVLHGICLLEGLLLKAGYSLRAGGSLLCIAKKENANG